MTFNDQVEAVTGITIGSGVTTTQLTQFLKDGVIDVTNKCLQFRPQDAEDFVVESTESSSQGALSTDGGKLLHVMRESGTNDDWRDCRKIPIGLKDRVTDINSLHYASAYNPAYILSQYGAVLVFPAPSGSSGQYRIYYVNKTPVNNVNGNALAHSDSTIRYFPDDKVYLVVLYASIQSLQAALSSKNLPSDISFPSIPSSLSLSSVPNLPSLSGDSVSFTTTAPTYSGPTVVPNFGDAENWISVEEDPEMLAGRIQTINSQIGEFQAKVQDAVQSFNSAEITSYQNDNQSKIAKFNSDLQSYTSEVSNKLQDYSAKIQKAVVDYGWMEARAKTLNEQYNNAFVAMAGSQPKAQPAPQPQRQYRR